MCKVQTKIVGVWFPTTNPKTIQPNVLSRYTTLTFSDGIDDACDSSDGLLLLDQMIRHEV